MLDPNAIYGTNQAAQGVAQGAQGVPMGYLGSLLGGDPTKTQIPGQQGAQAPTPSSGMDAGILAGLQAILPAIQQGQPQQQASNPAKLGQEAQGQPQAAQPNILHILSALFGGGAR